MRFQRVPASTARRRPSPAATAPTGAAGDRVPRPSLAALLARPGLRPVLLAGSRDPNGKLTIVLVDRHGPRYAVKVPPTDVAAAAVCREGRLLADLHAAGLGALSTSVPRPVGYVDADGLPALVATAVQGRSMAAGYHEWRHTARPAAVRRDFAAAGAWLARLHGRTGATMRPVRLLETALAAIETRFGAQPELRAGLAEPAQRLAAQATPRTAVHGDYWFGNLLVRGGAVSGVVDWEAGELAGEPLRDVARFAVSYSLYLDRHVPAGAEVPGHRGLRADGWGAGLAYAAAGRGWYADAVREFCGSALRRLGADPACASDLLLAGIAEVAATADHPDFAIAHLKLLSGLAVDGATT